MDAVSLAKRKKKNAFMAMGFSGPHSIRFAWNSSQNLTNGTGLIHISVHFQTKVPAFFSSKMYVCVRNTKIFGPCMTF